MRRGEGGRLKAEGGRRLSSLLLSAFCFLPSALSSQAFATLKGKVINDLTDAPIPGAEIVVSEFALGVVTDSAGNFLLPRVPAGRRIVLVRKFGFNPISEVVPFAASETVEREFTLIQAVTRLSTVEVKGRAAVTGKLAEFDERRRAGSGGHFITDSILVKNQDRRMAEIFAMVPGAHVVQGLGDAAWVGTSRGPSSLTRGRSGLSEMDRRRGASGAICYAAVVLDGAFVYQGLGEQLWDINSISPGSIAGIEYYADGATIPVKYNGTRNTCGLVVIWTK